MAVAKENATAMTTENFAPLSSRDLVTTALVLPAEALAALKAATAVTMVLAAEAAATLKAYNANGGGGGVAIVGGVSLAAGGRDVYLLST